ncbi:MAG: hypothetical protein IKI57_04435 [Clostridia bacterium]|nr:hypothetical protein [Clostridia bacterium]
MSNQGFNVPFDILGSDNKPLPLATCTGASKLVNAASVGQVQVYLRSDESDYKLAVYSDAVDGSAYHIIFERSGTTGVETWDLASSLYSSVETNDGVGDTDISSKGRNGELKDPGDLKPSLSSSKNGGNVDFVQKVISWIFTFGIADPLRGIIILLFGNVTIDNLLFNHFNDTKLSFYPENGRGTAQGNHLLETPSLERGLLHMVSEYYAIFRSIAITFYLIMLLYIGIRILLKSTARDKEKYKTMLSDWFTGVLLLLFFPYAIKYLIIFNETLIGILEERVIGNNDMSGGLQTPSANVDAHLLIAMGQKSEGGGSNKGLMLNFRDKAVDTGNLGYCFVYIYLLVKLFGFIIYYYKRLITILFLIVLFPFVAISYCLDKVKDGKAQIFSNWLKEFLLNVYTQFFQAVLWVIVMFVVNALIAGDSDNPVLICVGIGFVSKGDTILRALFPSLLGGGGANTVSPIEKTAQTAIAKRMIDNVTKKTQNTTKRFKDAKKSFTNLQKEHEDNKLNLLENRVQNQEKKLTEQAIGVIGGAGEGVNPVLDAATIRRNDGVSSGESRETANPKRDENLDKKFDAMQQLVTGLTLEQTAGSTQDALAQRMDKMSPAEKEKLMHELKVARATRELVTGKSADGRTLTRLELGLSANIVFEAMTSNDAKNRDAKRWLNNRKVTVGKKVPVSSSIKTKEDAIAWEKKHGRSAYKMEKTEMDLKDYLAFSDSKGGTVGQGLKGKVLTKDQQSQMQAGDAFLGGRTGLHTGKTVEGDVDSVTGQKTVSTRSNEGRNVGADKVISLSSDERERSHERRDSKGASVVDKMVSSYAGDIDATSSDKEEVKEAANLIMELAEYNERVNSSDPSQKAEGVSADEALRITDELTKMSKSNRRVAKMVQESVSTDKAGSTYKKTESVVKKEGAKAKKVEKIVKRTAVEETSKGVKVNLGVSVEGLRAMSAKTVLTDKKMDSETRTGSTQDAIEVLQDVAERVSGEDEFLDAIEAATYERSEMDAYLGEDAVISTGFSLGDGLVRDERSNEQILSDAFMKDIQSRSENDAAAKVEAMKRERPRKMVKAMTNIVDATVGNVARGAATITADALYIGADKTPTLKEFGVATTAGLGIGDAITKPIQKGGKVLDSVLEEREHRKKMHEAQKEHTAYARYNERSKNAKGAAAARNINAFKDKLS